MTDIFTQNDFWTNLKERLTNPFLLSFVLSWLIWNWPITIGLVWYNAENINRFGYSSYDSLIKCNTHWAWNLLFPLLSALFYTFGFPYFRNIVNSFNAKIDKEDQDNLLEISGTGNIPTLTFLELQKTYDERIKSLSDLIKTQSVTKSENISLSTTIAKQDKEIITLKENIQRRNGTDLTLRHNSDVDRLNGKWHAVYMPQGGITPFTAIWELKDTALTVFIDNSGFLVYRISSYACDPISRKPVLAFSANKSFGDSDEFLFFHNLQWDEEFTKLESRSRNTDYSGFLSLERQK